MALPPALGRTYLAVIALAVATFWSAYLAAQHQRSEWATLLTDRPRPVLMNGLFFRLSHSVTPPVEPTDSGRSLAIVLSDTCAYCLAELPTWKRLIETLPFRDDDRLLLISFEGTGLQDTLAEVARRRSLHTLPLSVPSRARFMYATGVSWTPETVALDSSLRVRISSERVTATVFREFVRWFGS